MAAIITPVPGPDYASANEVLQEMAAGVTDLRAAVAFVTLGGVRILGELLHEEAPVSLRLVARGAPITEPSALVQLADMGADVSVVVGAQAQAFHPKLWIGSASGRFLVLSGSGNLTEGGGCGRTMSSSSTCGWDLPIAR